MCGAWRGRKGSRAAAHNRVAGGARLRGSLPPLFLLTILAKLDFLTFAKVVRVCFKIYFKEAKMPKFLSTAKGKITTAVAVVSICAMNAAAAGVTVDSSTGVVSGDLDVKPFLSMFGVVIVAVAVMWAARRALSLISK